MYIFLVADRGQRHPEYTQSRRLFYTPDPSKPLALSDASKTPVYLPAAAAWGIMPACDSETGKPIEDAGDNYVITLAAPSARGIVSAEDLAKMKAVGFSLKDTCGLTSTTPVHKSPSDVSKATLREVAKTYLFRTEKELLPGKEVRAQEKAEGERRKEKRKAEMYCDHCKCSRCEQERQKT